MSRALNLDATHAHVVTTCTRLDLTITAIETLKSGGTRVVVANADSAATLRSSYGNKVMQGPVQRAPSRLMHN
jgi:hypothetical protein